LNAPIYWILSLRAFLFWGCPALRAGRAVPQLAGLLGPALFRFAQKLGLALWATAIHPSAKKGGQRPQKRPGRKSALAKLPSRSSIFRRIGFCHEQSPVLEDG